MRRLWRWLLRLGLACVLFSLALVTLYYWVDPPLMLIRSVEGLAVGVDHPRCMAGAPW
jgi:hypothetical protein